MEGSMKEKTWREDWKLFFNIILRPIIFFPLALVLILIWVNYACEDSLSNNVKAIFDFFIAFFTGIASTQAMDKLNKDKDETKIKIKASSAIRNLFNINEKLKNIIGRIKVQASIEEIRNLVIILQEDVNNAKEDWGDIVDISQITNFQEELSKLNREKEELLLQYNKSEGEKEEVKKQLDAKIKEKNNLEVRFNLFKATNKLDALGNLGTGAPADLGHGLKYCAKCGSPFAVLPSGTSVGWDSNLSLCRKCVEKDK